MHHEAPSVTKALRDVRLAPHLKIQSSQRAPMLGLVKKYYYQLTVGCGRQCGNPICEYAKKKQSIESSLMMAMELCQRPNSLICEHLPSNIDFELGWDLTPTTTPESTPPGSPHIAKSRDMFAGFSKSRGSDPVALAPPQSPKMSSFMRIARTYTVNLVKTIGAADPKMTEPTSSTNPRLGLTFMSLEIITAAIETYQTDPTFLIQAINSVFSSPSTLAKSFHGSHASGLNLDAVKQVYHKISELEPKSMFMSPMASAVEICIAKLKLGLRNSTTADTQKLRVILFILMVGFH